MAPISAQQEYLEKKRPHHYSMDSMKRQMRNKLLTLFSESEDHLRKLINLAEMEWINNIELLFPAQNDKEMKWLRKEMRCLERGLYTFQIKYYNQQFLFLKKLGMKWQINK